MQKALFYLLIDELQNFLVLCDARHFTDIDDNLPAVQLNLMLYYRLVKRGRKARVRQFFKALRAHRNRKRG